MAHRHVTSPLAWRKVYIGYWPTPALVFDAEVEAVMGRGGGAREAGRDARWGVDELLWSGLSLVSLVSMEPITALSATESARFSMYPILWGLGFSRFRPMDQSHQRQSWSTPCPSFPRSSTPLCYTNIGVCRYAFSAGTRLARDDNPSAHAEP